MKNIAPLRVGTRRSESLVNTRRKASEISEITSEIPEILEF